MKEITLTKGKYALVDDSDYEYLKQWKWYALNSRGIYYAARCEIVDGKRKTIMMHRVIMSPPLGLEPDHQNHNGLDNQRHNLKNVTHRQNILNQRHTCSKENKKGILKCSVNGETKYKCLVIINGQNTEVYFKTELEAARFKYKKGIRSLKDIAV